MDYKEKLRLAKEALESGSYDKDTIEYIFPELKESEDEKWIPKEIANYLKEKGDFRSCWLAWLEKQGEQKVEEIDEEYKIGKWFTGLIPCWINAPSTLQPEHSNHGKNVVAVHLKGGGYRCCCVDDKKPITFSVAENTPFVEGWHNRESSV